MRSYRNIVARLTTVHEITSITKAEGGGVKYTKISPLSPTPEHARQMAARLKLGPHINLSSVGGIATTGMVGNQIGHNIRPITAVFVSGQTTRAYILPDSSTPQKVAANRRSRRPT